MNADPPPPSPTLASRDRFLRRRMLHASPAERLAAMRLLLARARAILELNPEGMAHFRKRNFKARSIANTAKRTRHDA